MKRSIIALSSVGVVVLAGIGFAYWSNQPAITRPVVVKDVKGAETPDYTLKAYKTSYFDLQIPARFSTKSGAGTPRTPILIQQLFSSASGTNLYADQLAMTVARLPSGGLQEVSGVQLRIQTPEYSPISLSLPEGVVVKVFERADNGYELGAFVSHKSYYASFVFSGLSNKKPQLIHELQLMVSSIVWK